MSATTESLPTPRPKPAEICLGQVRLGGPFVQAALSGYSDWPMRLIARRHGASYGLCEVMLDQFLVTLKNRARIRHFLMLTDEERPVAGQLMGAEPEQFSLGAVKLVEAGFDVIDINFGCPVKKVLGRCRGGYHLSQPATALEIVQRTREKVPPHIPVTVKMRRGIDETQESRDRFYAILDGAFAAGISGVTLHGRTVEQRYVGPSRWAFLKEVKQHLGTRTLLGSGDLFTAHDCVQMIEQTGVDGVTIARGAIGNPWIFEQCRALAAGEPLPPPPSLFTQRAIIEEHYRLAEGSYGADRAGPLMRKFGIKYATCHPQSKSVHEAFVKVKNFDDWRAVLRQWYVEDLPGRYPTAEDHRALSNCGLDQSGGGAN